MASQGDILGCFSHRTSPCAWLVLERVSDPHICCRYNGEGFKFMGRGKSVSNFKPINPVLTDAQLAAVM